MLKSFIFNWIFIYTLMGYAQTGNEPKEIPNTSVEWCLKNAEIKNQHVSLGGCTWSAPVVFTPLPTDFPLKAEHCKTYAGFTNGRSPQGYEGQLRCPAPPSIGGHDTIYECAICVTSNNTSGTVDSECRISMYDKEIGFCFNKGAELDFKHEIGGLQPKLDGTSPPVPATFPYQD